MTVLLSGGLQFRLRQPGHGSTHRGEACGIEPQPGVAQGLHGPAGGVRRAVLPHPRLEDQRVWRLSGTAFFHFVFFYSVYLNFPSLAPF
jgi:hypothetical protein